MQIYLTGGWGYGNLGDDAILCATLEEIQRVMPNVTCTITSFKPAETDPMHGVQSIPSVHACLTPKRVGFLLALARVLIWWPLRRADWSQSILPAELRLHAREIKRSRVVVMAGGGYFNDRWITALPARLTEIAFANAAHTPIVIVGQTVGPFSSSFSKRWMGKVLRSFDAILYRDKQSRNVLEYYGVSPARMEWTADAATLLVKKDESRSRLRGIFSDTEGTTNVGVMVQKFRPYESASGTVPLRRIKSTQEYEIELLKGLRLVADGRACNFLFIPSTGWDRIFCTELAGRLAADLPGRVKVLPTHDCVSFVEVCQSVDVMISTNMHPIILAATAGVPAIGISYFYKMDDFMEDLGMSENLMAIDEVDGTSIGARFEEIEKSYETLSTAIEREMERVRTRARLNVERISRICARDEG